MPNGTRLDQAGTVNGSTAQRCSTKALVAHLEERSASNRTRFTLLWLR